MKLATAIVSLLSASAAIATVAPEPHSDNNNVKRHDRALGFDEAHIPDGARGAGIKEHIIKRHDRAPGFDEAHIPANARGGSKVSKEHVIKKDHVYERKAPLQ